MGHFRTIPPFLQNTVGAVRIENDRSYDGTLFCRGWCCPEKAFLFNGLCQNDNDKLPKHASKSIELIREETYSALNGSISTVHNINSVNSLLTTALRYGNAPRVCCTTTVVVHCVGFCTVVCTLEQTRYSPTGRTLQHGLRTHLQGVSCGNSNPHMVVLIAGHAKGSTKDRCSPLSSTSSTSMREDIASRTLFASPVQPWQSTREHPPPLLEHSTPLLTAQRSPHCILSAIG